MLKLCMSTAVLAFCFSLACATDHNLDETENRVMPDKPVGRSLNNQDNSDEKENKKEEKKEKEGIVVWKKGGPPPNSIPMHENPQQSENLFNRFLSFFR